MADQGARAGGKQRTMIDTTSITQVAVPALIVLVAWTGEAAIKVGLEMRMAKRLQRGHDAKHSAANAPCADRRKGTDRRIQSDRRAPDGRARDRRVSERRTFVRHRIDREPASA
jgi:hypothetical protein